MWSNLPPYLLARAPALSLITLLAVSAIAGCADRPDATDDGEDTSAVASDAAPDAAADTATAQDSSSADTATADVTQDSGADLDTHTVDSHELDTALPPDTGDTPDTSDGVDESDSSDVTDAATPDTEAGSGADGGPDDATDAEGDTTKPGCTSDATCNDGLGCTIDRCVAGTCVHTKHALCSDKLVPCDKSLPCKSGSCHPTWHVCLPCTAEAGCAKGEACVAGTCVPGIPCQSDKSCKATGQVCANGACADCASAIDCNKGESCSAGSCVQDVACQSSKQCAVGVCHKSKGMCAECQVDVDCGKGESCSKEGVCEPVICTAGVCGNASTWFACKGVGGYAPAKTCDDGDGCTTDACALPSGCTSTVNSEPCDDGDACTTKDTCGVQGCKGDKKDCDDGNPCTKDACDPKTGCSNSDTTGPCDDGSACTIGDACVSGACSGKKLACDDGKPCTDDLCDSKSGCVHKPNSKPCDDGNACTEADTCASGSCTGKKKSCDDNNPCTDDGCTPGTGCKNPANSAPCDDADACTAKDTCASGKCAGTKVVCDDGKACTVDACDKAKGCMATPTPSAPCDADGNACTSDTCQGDTCVAGKPKVCNSGDTCIAGKCDPKLGKCKYVSLPDQPCDDKNPCTTKDACKNDVCKGGALVSCDDNNPCTTDSCNPSKTGQDKCEHSPASGACDDGDKCTTKDTCVSSACKGQAVASDHCDDNKPCTTDVCDPKKGCTHGPAASGSCDDGDACTEGDTCKEGKCTAGKTVCACKSDSDCAGKNGGNLCLGTYVCDKSGAPSAWACTLDPKTVVTCDTSKDTVCSKTSCEQKTGKCVAASAPDKTQCDDGDACTLGDACTGGLCKPLTSLDCDDKNACTTDSCDPKSGCKHAAKTGACDDGNACTGNDACLSGKCVGSGDGCDDGNACTKDSCTDKTCSNVALTGPCDDGSACTSGEACKDGKCVSPAANCDDKNPCTYDSCDASAGKCSHLNTTALCDDGDPCTVGEKCSGGTCLGGQPKDCGDNEPCTVDTCVKGTGKCDNAATTGACDDGDSCTTGDACQGGKCTPASTLNCDDNNPCTTDSCDKGSGKCSNANVSDGASCGVGKECSNGVCAAACTLVETPTFTEKVYKMTLGTTYTKGGLVIGGAPKFGEYWATTITGGTIERFDANFVSTGKTFSTYKYIRALWGHASGDYFVAVNGSASAGGRIERLEAFGTKVKWSYKNPSNKLALWVTESGGKVYAVMLNSGGNKVAVVLDAASGNKLSETTGNIPPYPMAAVGPRIYALGKHKWSIHEFPSGKSLAKSLKTGEMLGNAIVFNGKELCEIPKYATARVTCYDVHGGCAAKNGKAPLAASKLLTFEEQTTIKGWIEAKLPLDASKFAKCQGLKTDNIRPFYTVGYKNGCGWTGKHTLIVFVTNLGTVSGFYTRGSLLSLDKTISDHPYPFLFVTDPIEKRASKPGVTSYYDSASEGVHFGGPNLWRCKTSYNCNASANLFAKNYECPSNMSAKQCLYQFTDATSFMMVGYEAFKQF